MSLIKVRKIATLDAGAVKDTAELRVVHAKGIGKWWVEPNLSRFNDADREQTHKGRKEFPDREAAMKYARGTGKTFIVNDACDATDANFKVGDKVKDKTRMYMGAAKIIDETDDEYVVKFDNGRRDIIAKTDIVVAADAAEFHVGQRVRAKDPRWPGYQGHALGNGVYTVKKVDSDGTVKLDGFLDVWISPSSLVEANDACGKRSR